MPAPGARFGRRCARELIRRCICCCCGRGGVCGVTRLRRRTLIAHAAAALLFLALWGPSLWNQRRIAEYRFLNDNTQHPLIATLWRINDLPLRYFVDVNWLREISYVPGVGIVVLALLAI